MYQNWYKSSNSKRNPIVMGEKEDFLWESVRDIDGSYSVVSIKVAETRYNFYIWSSKTVKTAHTLYEKSSFKKSLNMLKKYSFDVKINSEDGD